MELIKYKKELEKKKYNPLTVAQTNEMVAEYMQTNDPKLADEICSRMMRLAFKVTERFLHNRNMMQQDEVWDYILTANSAIPAALARYKESNIDFPLFVYYECLTYLRRYNLNGASLIKTRKLNGEQLSPKPDFDHQIEDEPIHLYSEVEREKLEELLQLLELPKKSKQRTINIYLDALYHPTWWYIHKTVSEKYGLSKETVRSSINKVNEEIRKNKNIHEKILELIEF